MLKKEKKKNPLEILLVTFKWSFGEPCIGLQVSDVNPVLMLDKTLNCEQGVGCFALKELSLTSFSPLLRNIELSQAPLMNLVGTGTRTIIYDFT